MKGEIIFFVGTICACWISLSVAVYCRETKSIRAKKSKTLLKNDLSYPAQSAEYKNNYGEKVSKKN